MILIDTNVLVNALTRPKVLSARTRHELESSSEVFVSALSFLELAIKERILGREPSDYRHFATCSNMHHLPFSAEDASHIPNFGALAGHDPFDRALLAQASANGARFLTSDQKLLSLGLSWVVDSQE